MGNIRQPTPVLLITSAFSRHGAALEWTAKRTIQGWGPIALVSPQFDFVETDYYEPTMGPGLKKIFFAYENLLAPGDLPRIKIEANQWEIDYAREGGHSEERPLNLDPGYITPAKVVLASTKDHSHRLYLSDGIYGEVTLKFSQGKWRERDWTFPDYRREDYHVFFTECRQYLRERQREGPE